MCGRCWTNAHWALQNAQRKHTKALVDKISIDWRKNVTNTFVETLQLDTRSDAKHNFYANVLEAHVATGLHRLFRAAEMMMSSLVRWVPCGGCPPPAVQLCILRAASTCRFHAVVWCHTCMPRLAVPFAGAAFAALCAHAAGDHSVVPSPSPPPPPSCGAWCSSPARLGRSS